MPVFFILVMSYALEGVFEAGSRSRPVEVLVVREDGGEMSRHVGENLKSLEGIVFHEHLNGQPLTLERAETLVLKGRYPLVLVFTKGFSDLIVTPPQGRKEAKPTIRFIHDPATNERLLAGVKGMIQGVIQKQAMLAAFSRRMGVPVENFAGRAASSGASAMPEACPGPGQPESIAEIKESVDPEVVFVSGPPRGMGSGRHPTATEQNVPAYTIFGVFFIVLTLAVSFVLEKKEGTFQRVLSSPIAPAALLLGKLFPYLLVNLIQIALMFAIGVVMFGMHLVNIPALLVVSVGLALAANGMGLMVASVGRTEVQVSALSVLLAITLSALGGMMVPAFVMPPTLRTLSLFTPHAWALSGYHDVIVRGLGIEQVLPETGVLLGFAAGFFLIALWRFRFD
jgi:ABC-2 type transport system permease protein